MTTIPSPTSHSSSPLPVDPAPDARADLVVVGGGLAGLTAAAFASRAGLDVVLLERSSEAGGRAATHVAGDFLFNVGPHALYARGPAARAFADLGVGFGGRRPSASGGLALHGGSLHALPGGFVSLLSTDLLSLSGKIEVARLLASFSGIDASLLRGRTLREWLDSTIRDARARELLEALMRLTSYANDPAASCAAAAVAQLQSGLDPGVVYLDHGWATLVAGLRRAAEQKGTRIRVGCRAESVRRVGDRFQVDTGAGRLSARAVVLAVPPRSAASLVEGSAAAGLAALAGEAVPVQAACLDLGLARLPSPRRLFVVGIDRPLYFSVHSASARLAPKGGALVHVAKYLGPGESDPKAARAELEAFCDLVQPGWRKEVVESRYLPSITVAGDLVPAGRTRAEVEVAGAEGLYLAGDWVACADEPSTMLADAAVASGREAARLAVRRLGGQGCAEGGASSPAARQAAA
jgi:phytoene dehydrogenase-like protein